VRQRPGQALLFDVDVPQFSARVAPAASFKDPTIFVDRVVPGVRIGLQDAAEGFEVFFSRSPLRSGAYRNSTAGASVLAAGRSSRT